MRAEGSEASLEAVTALAERLGISEHLPAESVRPPYGPLDEVTPIAPV